MGRRKKTTTEGTTSTTTTTAKKPRERKKKVVEKEPMYKAELEKTEDRDLYAESIERLKAYNDTHDDKLSVDDEEIKKMAEAGFTLIVADEDSEVMTDEVKATFDFIEQIEAQENSEGE